jgi:hypothetical protein
MVIDDFKRHIITKGRCTKQGVSGNVNIKVNGFGIGGSFTVLFNWLLLFGEGVDNIYVEISDEWKKTTGINKNIFDLILEQEKIEGANEITIYGHHLHNFNNEVLNYLRTIIKNKIKIKSEIFEKLNTYLVLNNIENLNSLCGVHVRLTDMSHFHKDIYGSVTFDTYVNEMKKIDNKTKYFIASDNQESIYKLEKIFPDRVNYFKNINRVECESETGLNILNQANKPIQKLGIHRLQNEENIVNDFIDLLALSKCGKLIGMKYSIYKIAALLLSETITQNNNTELPLNFSL